MKRSSSLFIVPSWWPFKEVNFHINLTAGFIAAVAVFLLLMFGTVLLALGAEANRTKTFNRIMLASSIETMRAASKQYHGVNFAMPGIPEDVIAAATYMLYVAGRFDSLEGHSADDVLSATAQLQRQQNVKDLRLGEKPTFPVDQIGFYGPMTIDYLAALIRSREAHKEIVATSDIKPKEDGFVAGLGKGLQRMLEIVLLWVTDGGSRYAALPASTNSGNAITTAKAVNPAGVKTPRAAMTQS